MIINYIESKCFNFKTMRSSLTIAMLFIFTFAYSQDSIRTFWDGITQKSPYSKPFQSEMHSTMNKIEWGYNKSYSEFDLLEQKSTFVRPMVEVHLGFEVPIVAYGYGTKASTSKWGFGMRLPVSVHVLEDMWGPETAPVIDTDYRFGGPRVVGIRHVSDDGFVKNISFSWQTLLHECTHLGDEIAIYRMNENFPIKRINVSYEFTEFQLTLNDPEMIKDNNHAFRLGYIYRLSNRGLGWFSVREGIETNPGVVIAPSAYRAEYYAEYQMQRTKGFLASKRCVNVLSFDARERLHYGYPIYQLTDGVMTEKVMKENRELCLNLYLGYKFYPKVNDGQSVGLFFHAYKGLNPYGQLRNYPSYPFFGASLTYEP